MYVSMNISVNVWYLLELPNTCYVCMYVYRDLRERYPNTMVCDTSNHLNGFTSSLPYSIIVRTKKLRKECEDVGNACGPKILSPN